MPERLKSTTCRSYRIGAAGNLHCVKVAAAVQGVGLAITAMSRSPVNLMPAATPAASNPGTVACAPVYPISPPTDLGCSLSRQGSRDAAPLNPVVQSEAAPSDRTKPGTSGVTRPPPSSISLLPSPTRPASWPPPDRSPRDSSGSRLYRRSDPRRLPRSLAAGVESPGSRSRPHLTPLSPSHSVQRTPPIPGGRQPQKGTSRLDF